MLVAPPLRLEHLKNRLKGVIVGTERWQASDPLVAQEVIKEEVRITLACDSFFCHLERLPQSVYTDIVETTSGNAGDN